MCPRHVLPALSSNGHDTDMFVSMVCGELVDPVCNCIVILIIGIDTE